MSTNVLQRHFTALQGGKARTAPSLLPFSRQGFKKSPSPKEERAAGLLEVFKIEDCYFGCLFSSIPPTPQHSERVFEMGWGSIISWKMHMDVAPGICCTETSGPMSFCSTLHPLVMVEPASTSSHKKIKYDDPCCTQPNSSGRILHSQNAWNEFELDSI